MNFKVIFAVCFLVTVCSGASYKYKARRLFRRTPVEEKEKGKEVQKDDPKILPLSIAPLLSSEFPSSPKPIHSSKAPEFHSSLKPEIKILEHLTTRKEEPIISRSEPVSSRPELSSMRPEPMSNRPELVSGRPEPVSHRPELSTERPEPLIVTDHEFSSAAPLIKESSTPVDEAIKRPLNDPEMKEVEHRSTEKPHEPMEPKREGSTEKPHEPMELKREWSTEKPHEPMEPKREGSTEKPHESMELKREWSTEKPHEPMEPKRDLSTEKPHELVSDRMLTIEERSSVEPLTTVLAGSGDHEEGSTAMPEKRARQKCDKKLKNDGSSDWECVEEIEGSGKMESSTELPMMKENSNN